MSAASFRPHAGEVGVMPGYLRSQKVSALRNSRKRMAQLSIRRCGRVAPAKCVRCSESRRIPYLPTIQCMAAPNEKRAISPLLSVVGRRSCASQYEDAARVPCHRECPMVTVYGSERVNPPGPSVATTIDEIPYFPTCMKSFMSTCAGCSP